MRILREALLLSLSPFIEVSVAASGGECIDLNGRIISPGIHYVPGPDTCTLCECDGGTPKWCKAVLCNPPQDCKSFRVGNSCCDFICLDDTLPKSDGNPDNTADLGLRLIASVITAILSLSLLFFLIHRLRQRKIRGRQNRQLTEDQRSLGSIGYIAGSIGYLPGSMGYLTNQEHIDFPYDTDPRSNFALWKPPENYFPRGEAPPPYEEAVAAARAEAMAAAINSSLMGGTSLPPNCVSIAVVPSSGTLHRDTPRRTEAVQVLSSLPPPPPEPGSTVIEMPVNVLQAIRSDAFYEDVQPAPPPSLVEYVNVEQTRAVKRQQPVAAARPLMDPLNSSNLTTMNDLNKSTCSCPDDNDDYRSECENCKSTHGSRYLDPEPNITPHETMTLQRRPPSLTPNTANGYGTSLTLPSQSRRLREQSQVRGRDLMPPFSVRLSPPQWSDSSSSSRSPSPERRKSEVRRPSRTSSSSEGLGEASTHM